MSTTQDEPPDPVITMPPPRRAGEFERHVVIAEANLLIRQLDQYLELIGLWAEEEG